jgi:hypothetical protein
VGSRPAAAVQHSCRSLAKRGGARQRSPASDAATQHAIARIGVVAVALLMTVIVAWYFDRFDGPYFDRLADAPADWRTFRYALVAGAALGLSYLLLAGWTATKNMMCAHDRCGGLHASWISGRRTVQRSAARASTSSWYWRPL